MIRIAAFVFALIAAPAFADDDHHHLAEAQGIRAVHAWTNATDASTALVYIEIENTTDTEITLTGAESDIAAGAELVGLANSGGTLAYQAIPAMPIPARSEIVLSPNGLALRLTGLTLPLLEGEEFEIELDFNGIHLHAHVEIESASATQHSHAGHHH